MCIAILTTTHPSYALILLNNRDEYLSRPTAPLTWWPAPHTHVLGGYDLHRPVHGTWLGVAKQGRIAVLTNYREETEALVRGVRSRGEIANAWLTHVNNNDDDDNNNDDAETPDTFAQKMLDGGVHGVGGFSLTYGTLHDLSPSTPAEKRGLRILSNRSTAHIPRILDTAGSTVALSNTVYSDTSWPKVRAGEALAAAAVQASVQCGEGREELVQRLLGVLGTDTMPKRGEGESLQVYMRQLRESVFIPAVCDADGGGEGSASTGWYGTGKQSVVLVDWEGGVYYLERTLFDGDARPIAKGEGDRVVEFQVEGWGK